MLAVVKLRGSVEARKDIQDTLDMLRLKKTNSCVILPETPQYLGMLKKVGSFVTWGRIQKSTLVFLLEKRGRTIGNKAINKSFLEKNSLKDLDEMADAIISGKINFSSLKGVKPVFRLNPPKRGYKAVKLQYPKGDTGDRKEKINELLERMM